LKKWLVIAVLFVIAIAAAGIFAKAQAEQAPLKLVVSSPAFMNGGRIPVKYTCDGQDISPPLSWTAGPAATRSYALVADDLDARGEFVHWVIYNMPVSTAGLKEQTANSGRLADGTFQGKNSYGNIGYGGPCPPAGKPHHYRFRVYALDKMLSLGPGASMGDVMNAMSGHVLAEGELIGIYSR
jgi:Raf kinase inhibitor-like YbhB/YbcL family protein